ncbi:MAG: ABC transporter ATP-binding protein [Pseudomonadota bacterium]
MSVPILEIKNLKKHFPVRKGLFNKQVATKYVVDGISFKIENGQTVALVGESGCGKSALLRTIIGLDKPTEGSVHFKGQAYDQMKKGDLKEFRSKIQLIFQDPLASLFPKFTIAQSLEEPLILNGMSDAKKREEIIVDTLNQVGLDPEFRFRYPEQLSGGQRQRVIIARALVVQPELILADEPISALDVSLQAQVLNFLMDLQESYSLSMLFVAHDLAVVRQIADHIMIMYAGKILESAPSSEIYTNAKHPYTKVLLESAPSISKGIKDMGFNLNLKIGDTPDPASPPAGCLFNTRCTFADKECMAIRPESREISPNHFVACHKI